MKRSLLVRGGAPRLAVFCAVLAAAPLSFAENSSSSSSPRFSPEQASRILTLRNVGLAELEEDKPKEARATFAKLAELVPQEALPLADGAVAALREKDLAGAEALLAKAGDRADVWAIRAALENERNRPAAMRAALEKAAALDPRDLESRWRYARSVESDQASGAAEKAKRRVFLSEIVRRSPSNLPARLKLLLLEVEAGDGAAAKRALSELEPFLSDGDARSRQFLSEARDALGKGDLKAASVKVRILENVQRVTPRYLQSLGEVFTQVVGLPVERFSSKVEEALRAGAGPSIPVSFRAPAALEGDLGRFLRKADLANSGAASLYPIPAPFTAVVFFDYDLDGDLDVYLLGGTGPDRLLRNNLDGTFTDVTARTGDAVFQSRKAVASDVDRDGDLDLVVIDAKGDLVLRLNERQGVFRTVPLHVSGAVDLAVEDVNGDGIPDIVVATSKGLRLLLGKGDGDFLERTGQNFSAASGGAGSGAAPGAVRAVVLGDFDNDGFPDVVAASSDGLHAWRNQGGGTFTEWPLFSSPSKKSPLAVSSEITNAEALLAYDVDKDGDLDLLVSAGGKTFVLVNDGGNANGWLTVALEGLATGSGKVNRGGVGSLVEVKAGNLVVTRTAGLWPTHVGLGARTRADVVRATWTNGIPQNVFDQRARTVVREVQQLKGSCPFVYALNGENGVWSFVSDALGRAPIGLLYDGVHLAGADTREWLLVPDGMLAPTRDGTLLLDYTEELWEAAYLDEVSLMAVDHPAGTAVVPNERMIPGATEKKLFTVARPRPVRAAWSDASGRTEDVTARLRRADKVYVDPGAETAYQGVRKEHALVLDLGPVANGSRVVLFLNGWIFYTDTSINVSLSQRKDLAPFAPVLDVPDGRGGWKVAMAAFGFPAGKTKTMPVDLTGLVDPADPRVRIRTTMAVFWDEAYVTVDDPAVEVVTTLLSPVKAVLSERGFSRRYRETPDGPELFDHGDVSVAPAWEDVPGRVTRLGDVTDLLSKTDDRWVVFKGGDAIRITYDASRLPPLREGWKRDWVVVSDGWDKDFDKNTVTGQTYGPWPFHAMSAYPYPDAEHYPDPTFLEETLTREAGPERFRKALGERSRCSLAPVSPARVELR
ncbi:MAG TPA: FG-GAP-like repeat-containing protein [Thermoanaerobaculia bacterium]|nr:FG-GAP-like repeat-containing protein [Thermoanaerobaculia bacterium]